jgi:hypothetical protein
VSGTSVGERRKKIVLKREAYANDGTKSLVENKPRRFPISGVD